jgi:hypothetical protein
MHLSVDSLRTLAEVRDALPRALAAGGLVVASVHEIPAGGFVTELADPLPEIATGDGASARDRTTYKIAAYARAAGGARLSTIRPTHLVELLDRPELAAPAKALETRLETALFEAAGRGGEPRT